MHTELSSDSDMSTVYSTPMFQKMKEIMKDTYKKQEGF